MLKLFSKAAIFLLRGLGREYLYRVSQLCVHCLIVQIFGLNKNGRSYKPYKHTIALQNFVFKVKVLRGLI